MNILVINCGSSSLKYQLINSDTEAVLAKGLCERIGIEGSQITYQPAGGEKEGYIREIGTRLCQANYYTYDREVSDKNKERSGYGVLRVIFSIIGRQGKKQYISLDFEKGMFEYYDYLGRHMGEYRFDGSNNKRAERSHDILV